MYILISESNAKSDLLLCDSIIQLKSLNQKIKPYIVAICYSRVDSPVMRQLKID